MKNFEKYKSAKEANDAWVRFCNKHSESCEGCPCDKTLEICTIAWMYSEAEEELKPCPFCGGKAELTSSVESWVECSVCHSRTNMMACDGGAIEQWNRRTVKRAFAKMKEEHK